MKASIATTALALVIASSAAMADINYKVPDSAGATSPVSGKNWVTASDAAASVYHNAVPASENDAQAIINGLKLCGAQIRAHKFKSVGQERKEDLGDVDLLITPKSCMLIR